MDVIWHDYKLVNFEFSRGYIGTKNINEQVGHTVQLQQPTALNAPRGHKVSSSNCRRSIRGCVS